MAAIVPVVDSLDKVAEPLRSFYEQKDGKYHIIMDGAPVGFVPAADLTAANAKVVEFRDNNIKLTQKVGELEPLVKKFEGIDADAARTALTEIGKLKEKGVTKAEELQAIIDASNKPLKDQIALMATSLAERQAQNDSMTLRSTIAAVFSKAGGRADATDFIVDRAKATFKVDNGQVVAQPNKFSTVKPGDPLSVEEWITQTAKESAFAFEPSKGGPNPATGGGGGTGRVLKPGQTLLKDPTPAQLGEFGKEISKGTMVVEYSPRT